MQSALIGSWHNSGFYGHYRGQVKSESAGEYRLAAKPPPPAVFLQRCEEPARQHFFSKHDNRTSFDKGPYCLLQGIGRRKDLERLWKRHTFLRWAPCELELSQQPPLESSYQADFPSGTGLSRLPQRLVHFVQVQPPYANTTYQHNFCRPSRGGHCGSAKSQPPWLLEGGWPDAPSGLHQPRRPPQQLLGSGLHPRHPPLAPAYPEPQQLHQPGQWAGVLTLAMCVRPCPVSQQCPEVTQPGHSPPTPAGAHPGVPLCHIPGKWAWGGTPAKQRPGHLLKPCCSLPVAGHVICSGYGPPCGDMIGPHLESARAVRLCLTSPRDLAFTWRRNGKQRIRATVKKQMNDT